MKALHLYQGQINAPDQLDCMSTLRTDNSQTLVNALAEIEKLKGLLSTDSTSTLNDAMFEIEQRDAVIARQSAALLVALSSLDACENILPVGYGLTRVRALEAITTIKAAL
jgi:hypothetical protein